MKQALTLAIAFLMGGWAMGQDLPQPSPAATVQQRVGLTDVEIVYSRPAMKGREIFGSLVPYNEMWRTGANKATSISFSTAVTIDGKKVEAGTYSLFTIPSEESWTIILNKNTELWGTDGYSQDMDVVRVDVRPTKTMEKESMSISVENISMDGADIVIAWSDVALSFSFQVETKETAMANISMAIEENPEDWRVYRNAANYYHQNKIDPKQALVYIEKSVEINPENWYSHFLHAQILASNGQNDEAQDAVDMALKLGTEAAKKEDREFGYSEMLEQFKNSLED